MPTSDLADCANNAPRSDSSIDLESPWLALDRFIRALEDGQLR